MKNKTPFERHLLEGAVVIFLFLLGATCLNAQTLPQTLVVVDQMITIKDCNYDGGSTPDKLSGSGKMYVGFGTAKDSPLAGYVTFSGVKADGGKVQSGSIKINNFLDAALTLDIQSWTVKRLPTVPATSASQGINKVELSLALVLTTPFNDEKGAPFQIDFRGGKKAATSTLTLSSDGNVRLDCKGGTALAIGGGADSNFSASALKISAGNYDFAFKYEAGKPSFDLTCNGAKVETRLPGLITDTGRLKLTTGTLVVTETGEVKPPGQIPSLQFQVDGLPQTISLSDPPGFSLDITKADAVFNKSWLKFAITAAVKPGLPQFCVRQTMAISLPARIDNLTLDLLNPTKISINNNPTKIPFNNMSSVCVGNYEIQRPGSDDDVSINLFPSTQQQTGLIFTKAKIALDDNIFTRQISDNPLKEGLFITSINDCRLSPDGFHCTIDVQGQDIQNILVHHYNFNLSRFKIQLGRSSITSSDIKGSIKDPGGTEGRLAVDVKLGDSGADVKVGSGVLKNKNLGLVMNVFGGTATRDDDGKWNVWIDGTVSLDVPGYASLKNAAMGFHRLGIDTTGAFNYAGDPTTGGRLDTPADVDFGLFRCNVSSLFFDPKYVQLFGEISLNGDLPVTGIAVNTLKVKLGPEIDSEMGLTLQAEIPNVAGFAATLNLGTDDTAPYLLGNAQMSLLFGGLSKFFPGPDLSFQMKTYGSSWAVAGYVKGAAIPLGTTGLFVNSFGGGVAKNFKTIGKDFTGKSGAAIFKAIDITTDTMVFMADVGVYAIADPVFHCDGSLTIGLPDFAFNLHGSATVLDNPVGDVDISIDPTVPMFRASADLNLNLPSKTFKVIGLSGSMDLLMKPGDVHLNIGWPYPQKAIQASLLNGAFSRSRFGMQARLSNNMPGFGIGLGSKFDYGIFGGQVEVLLDGGLCADSSPYFRGSVFAEGEVDFLIASLDASADLRAGLRADPNDLNVKCTNNGLCLDGKFSAEVCLIWCEDVTAHLGTICF